MAIERDVRFLNRETTIRCDEEQIDNEGVLRIPYADLDFDGTEMRFEFDEPLPFHDSLPAMVSQIVDEMEEGEEGGEEDTDKTSRDEIYGNGYSEPRYHNEGTNYTELLMFVYDAGPTISTWAKEITGLEYASSMLSDLSEQGLIEMVGKKKGCNVYHITPEGVKEVFALREGVDIEKPGEEKGLQALFNNNEN